VDAAPLREAERLARRVGERWLCCEFSLSLAAGECLVLLGPNGAGKTTLIQTLLGRLKPTSGTVRLGTNLEVAYFDQHREELDPDLSVRQCVAEGSDQVTIGGHTRHV
ncbi:ATP-binding cassette domain-containing protein, partial [Citrobacter sp. AAK_AS5]